MVLLRRYGLIGELLEFQNQRPGNFPEAMVSAMKMVMKLVFVLCRRAGLTHDQSLAQWNGEQHTSIVRMIPGLKRWVQNHAIAVPGEAAADESANYSSTAQQPWNRR